MKQGKLKSMFIFGLVLAFLITLVYASVTTLISPIDNSIDDDGKIDFEVACIPSTSWNVTNATLYTNIGGVWLSNRTLQYTDPVVNSTAYFNFTNIINETPEGAYIWNAECGEKNYTSATVSSGRTSFAGNNTITVRYSRPTIITTSPADGTYSSNGHEIDVVCTARPSSGRNITKIDLLTSIKGGLNWTINQTFTPTRVVGVEVVANFTINKIGNNSIADGTNLLYGCSATQIKDGFSTPTSEKSSTNRTINVEYPPLVTINKPANNNWSQTQTATLSWTVTSAFDSGIAYSTRIWTNESGTWNPRTGAIQATNDTAVTKTYFFNEKSNIVWSVQAIQSNDANVFNFSVNRTIRIDTTNPVISVSTANANRTTNDNTLSFTFTPTDLNLDTIRVFSNTSGTWRTNFTNNTADDGIVSGAEVTIDFNSTQADGFYIWSVVANDSSARETSTVNYSLIIDTTAPTISVVTNVSVVDKCDQRNITFTTSELTNASLAYDTDINVADGTNVVSSPTKTTSHGLVLDFDFNGEITHYFNITATDLAGNTVSPTTQTTFQTPARVCAGWSQYAVYDAFVNLSTIQNQSGADLVYFWNQTNQEWVFKTAGLTSNDAVNVGYKTGYHVVHLFENTNSTWLRNTTNSGIFNYNVSSVNNFISIPSYYNFGNLTESFGNTTFRFPSFINVSANNFTLFGPFNITFFAGYNNTAQDYVSHIFNFTWANVTILEPCPNRAFKETCMETFWVASDFNVTWNGTAIERNWTI